LQRTLLLNRLFSSKGKCPFRGMVHLSPLVSPSETWHGEGSTPPPWQTEGPRDASVHGGPRAGGRAISRAFPFPGREVRVQPGDTNSIDRPRVSLLCASSTPHPPSPPHQPPPHQPPHQPPIHQPPTHQPPLHQPPPHQPSIPNPPPPPLPSTRVQDTSAGTSSSPRSIQRGTDAIPPRSASNPVNPRSSRDGGKFWGLILDLLGGT
jgi:outer membrane biosynthesis protein TonB